MSDREQKAAKERYRYYAAAGITQTPTAQQRGCSVPAERDALKAAQVRDEILVGPFLFEYDKKHHEVYISIGEEQEGNVSNIWPDTWAEFVGTIVAWRLDA